MTAGYSGKPLGAKLGIKDGSHALLVKAPADLDLDLDDVRATITRRRGRGPYDVIVLFAPDYRTLRSQFAALIPLLPPAGALWACWPKRASGVLTDLTEMLVHQHGLEAGLVDVKVAAIDATWSGFKFVRRLVDR